MPRFRPLRPVCLAALVAAAVVPAVAEEPPAIPLPSESLVPGILVSGSVSADETVHYTLSGAQGQVLSVDLNGAGPLPDFLIREAGKSELLFLSTEAEAPLTDLALPQPGDYVIEVFLGRAQAAGPVEYDLAVGVNPPQLAEGLAGGPDWFQVVGPQALTLRAGPAERFAPVGVAEAGAIGRNAGCHLNMGTRWCAIALTGAGGRGWLPGAMLTAADAPAAP